MRVQRFFCVYPPDKGPFVSGEVLGIEPKTITVRGEEVHGWIVTIASDEDRVHPMLRNIEDGE